MAVQINLPECGWNIQDADDGGKVVIVQDPQSQLMVIIPLTEDVAKQWASKLLLAGAPGGTVVAIERVGANGHLPLR